MTHFQLKWHIFSTCTWWSNYHNWNTKITLL